MLFVCFLCFVRGHRGGKSVGSGNIYVDERLLFAYFFYGVGAPFGVLVGWGVTVDVGVIPPVGVTVGVPVGVPVPVAVGDGTAVDVAVAEATISVK